MREMGENPTEEEIQELLKELDTDGNGVISWDEFLNAMAEWLTEDVRSRTWSRTWSLWGSERGGCSSVALGVVQWC